MYTYFRQVRDAASAVEIDMRHSAFAEMSAIVCLAFDQKLFGVDVMPDVGDGGGLETYR